MKITTLATVVLATFGLVACGGNGSSSGSAPSPMVQQPNNPAPAPKTETGIAGNIITLNYADNSVATANAKTAASTNINTVVIDGKPIVFMPSGINTQQLSLSAGNMTRVGGSSALSYTRFGYTKEGRSGKTSTSTPYLFAQGDLTTNMPTTGTATYNGLATHVEKGGHPSIRQSTFKVDYAQKTVTGTITSNLAGTTAVQLAGNIDGNRFSGKKGDFSTNGAFYGPNAAELGGTYSNSTGTVSGAYGAKK